LPASARHPKRLLVQLNFSAYPVQASLGVLGRKWALLVLLNIAIGRAQRFNEMLRSAPGMSKRILAMRLRELEQNGFIVKAERARGYTRWSLAAKGADVLPVLLTLVHFESKWRSHDGSSGDGSTEMTRTFNVTYVTERKAPSKPPEAR
jgi:DNA-binding HxlR family transcriptional regulator